LGDVGLSFWKNRKPLTGFFYLS